MVICSFADENDPRTMEGIDRFIREKEYIALTTLANSARWRMEQVGGLPRHIKIGERAVGCRFSEVQVWIRGEWRPGREPGKIKQQQSVNNVPHHEGFFVYKVKTR